RAVEFAGRVLDHEMLRRPPCRAADTVRLLERQQELVTYQQVVAKVERIPLLCRNAGDGCNWTDVHGANDLAWAAVLSACPPRRSGPGTCPRRARPCSLCRPR